MSFQRNIALVRAIDTLNAETKNKTSEADKLAAIVHVVECIPRNAFLNPDFATAFKAKYTPNDNTKAKDCANAGLLVLNNVKNIINTALEESNTNYDACELYFYLLKTLYLSLNKPPILPVCIYLKPTLMQNLLNDGFVPTETILLRILQLERKNGQEQSELLLQGIKIYRQTYLKNKTLKDALEIILSGKDGNKLDKTIFARHENQKDASIITDLLLRDFLRRYRLTNQEFQELALSLPNDLSISLYRVIFSYHKHPHTILHSLYDLVVSDENEEHLDKLLSLFFITKLFAADKYRFLEMIEIKLAKTQTRAECVALREHCNTMSTQLKTKMKDQLEQMIEARIAAIEPIASLLSASYERGILQKTQPTSDATTNYQPTMHVKN